MNITEKAKYCRSFFELKEVTRNGEKKSIYINKDHENETITDLCRSAHENGEILPDDFRYSKIVDTLDMIINREPETEEEAHDYILEMEADIYTSDLTAWLNSSNNRVYYLTEALEQFECKDGFNALAMAQSI